MNKILPPSDLKRINSVIFSLIEYYLPILEVELGETSADLFPVIEDRHDICVIHFVFPLLGNCRYTPAQIQRIFQDYLHAVLLPNSSLAPYLWKDGERTHLFDALYIENVTIDITHLKLSVLYLNNPFAFEYIKDKCPFY